MRNKKFIATLLCTSVLLGFAGCSDEALSDVDQSDASAGITEASDTAAEAAQNVGKNYLEDFETFSVTSEDLTGGVWDDIISNTDRGENRSPQLSWDPVDEASEYAIYMIDTNSNNWLLWKSLTSETELPEGWAPQNTEYSGPNPGSGHVDNLVIYVVALRTPVDRLKGAVNGTNDKFESFILGLDIDSDGNPGNIAAYGIIAGTFK